MSRIKNRLPYVCLGLIGASACVDLDHDTNDAESALADPAVAAQLERISAAGWSVDGADRSTMELTPRNQKMILLGATKTAGADRLAAQLELIEVGPQQWDVGFQSDALGGAELRKDMAIPDAIEPLFAHGSCTVAPVVFTSCKTPTIRANGLTHDINYGALAAITNSTDWQLKDADNGTIIRQGHLPRNGSLTGTTTGLFGAYYMFVFNTRFDTLALIDNK
jgi:hypothetical protein